jgi:hypothetical protein
MPPLQRGNPSQQLLVNLTHANGAYLGMISGPTTGATEQTGPDAFDGLILTPPPPRGSPSPDRAALA